jgi:hypothetical protein
MLLVAHGANRCHAIGVQMPDFATRHLQSRQIIFNRNQLGARPGSPCKLRPASGLNFQGE